MLSLCAYYDLYVYTTISMSILQSLSNLHSLCVYYNLNEIDTLYVYTTISMKLTLSMCILQSRWNWHSFPEHRLAWKMSRSIRLSLQASLQVVHGPSTIWRNWLASISSEFSERWKGWEDFFVETWFHWKVYFKNSYFGKFKFVSGSQFYHKGCKEFFVGNRFHWKVHAAKNIFGKLVGYFFQKGLKRFQLGSFL